MKRTAKRLIRETVGDMPYEYYPPGKHIVAAPEVCGGRPTFKYTRLEVSTVLDLLAAGWTIERTVHEYVHSRLTPETVTEAIKLAKKALVTATTIAQPTE
jgi:uncharacterized protein (DUF433 family)